MPERENIVIIGGGFAGLNLLRKLDKNKYSVTLIDRFNYHSFPPLFYQIASAGIDPSGISYPLRREMRHYTKEEARFDMGDVRSIDTVNKIVTTDRQQLSYNKLVIAAGTTNNFFGIKGLEEKVYTLKTTEESLRLRNDILERLELAAIQPDREKQREMLRFVVVGGGPAGVEIAGALGEMKRFIIPREYPRINRDDLSITIVEGSGKLLGTMSEKSSRQAKEYLEKLMVDVELGKTVKNYENGSLECADGVKFDASMVIWTAGITTVGFDISGSEIEYGRGHRIIVDEFNKVKGTDDIFALGDICIMTGDPAFPGGHPQLAQVAIQQAKNLARNLNSGNFKKSFRYHDKGSMATVGRNRAVVDLPRFHFGGPLAWLTWMFIHLISIMGFRNKTTVLINWIWAYFTYGTAMRLLFKINSLPRCRPVD